MKKIIIYLFLIYCFNLISCGNKEVNKEISIKRSDHISESNESENSVQTDLKENSTDGFSNDGENSEGQSQGNNNSIKVITSKEVKNHIGDSLVIRGLVADVYVSEKVSYLNFENRFPKNVFACAIFSSKTDAFGDLSKYKGKLVEVNGKISTFKNKPQVILNSPDQIKILK
ncbi:MAG: hypothetical protein KDD00_14710 [Ignavibacteriae bacterium]|nr:hypothetical protein [Ignavibacteriota bacterium]